MLSNSTSRRVARMLSAVALFVFPPSAAAASANRHTKPGSKLAISPAPGTVDASPNTQISILGVGESQIRSVLVTGSLTGRHRGGLRGYSDGRGASFLLNRPFDQGEHVAVRIRIAGFRRVAFSFAVAHLAPIPPVLNIPVMQPDKLDHFVSRPDLLAPRITVLKGGASGGGDIFLTPIPSPVVHPGSNNAITIKPVGPGGPMIIDQRGNLVWFHRLKPPGYAINFRPQLFAGREVLTWWQGTVTADAFGLGEGVIASPSYRTLRTVHAGNGYAADLHEFAITPSGDAIFTAYTPILTHLPGTAPGALSPLLDALVQEVDIRTGLVVWEWHALGHIPLSDSYANPTNSADYDAFHINSVQPLPGNRVLVSARDTSAIYLVDRRGGKIVWTLGGKASTFRLGRGARFWFQHDAQMLGPHAVGMFDDEAGPPFEAPSSRALILSLNMRRRTAMVVRQYRRPENTLAQSEGSLQELPGGNVFVGFGSAPVFSEFSPSGRIVFDASLPADDGSYREFRFPWHTVPGTRPTVVVKRLSPGRVAVYASWNGATDVARWQVLAGSSLSSIAGRGSSVSSIAGRGSSPRRGFETEIDVSSPANKFAVRALSSNGRVLATSTAVQPS